MKESSYVITDELGIHARPAGQLVKLAGSFKSSVNISSGTKSADAKRILAVMGLAAKKGDSVKIRIEGEDEAAAATQITAFFKENL